jgi:uncharacterized protein YndB with AHSA1/START domain
MEKTTSTFKVAISAPARTVWNALTNPDSLKRWFLREAVLELRPQGMYEFYWGERNAAGNYPVVMSGQCLKVENEKILKLSWNTPEDFVQFSLEESGEETIVIAHVDGFERGSRGHIDESRGWTFYLLNLKTVLERNWDLRETNSTRTLKEDYVNYFSYR